MEIQKQILLFFCDIRTPFLNIFNQIVTFFGETVLVLSACFFIFYCLDKKKGLFFIMSLFAADMVMNIAKAIFQVPRPFMVYEEIKCLKESTATGYSFPSGHSTQAGVLFTFIAKYAKKRITAVLCIIMIFLVGISRLYLACHWPLDVLVGWALGISFTLLVTNIFSKLYDNKKVIMKFFPLTGIACIAICFIFAIAVDYFGADYRRFSDLTKNLAVLGGVLPSIYLEEKYFCFEISKSWTNRLINFLGAFLGALFFLSVLKKIVPDTLILGAIRYGLSVVWGFGLWPAIAQKTHLL